MADNKHSFPIESQPADVADPTPEANDRTRRFIGLSILGMLALVLALIGLDVAVVDGAQNPPPRPIINRQVVKVAGTAQIQRTMYLSVSPGIKPGPDGKLHDAFSVTSFEVRAGQPMKLVIDNTDDAPHSITSPAAGLNLLVKPGTHTYTLIVHSQGVFTWYCSLPCDPFSMAHVGYMRGTITSV